MKKMLALMIALTPMASLAADYEIDPAHTYPNFTISHLGFSTMHGQFAKTSGMIQMDMEKKTGAVDITIDAASIYTGHQKRDDHLRSPDFLNVVEFPEITYKSTSVKFQGKDKATVEGDLTRHGSQEFGPRVSNADGAFKWDDLAAGHYTISVKKRFYPREDSEIVKTFSVSPGEHKIVNIGDDLGDCVLYGQDRVAIRSTIAYSRSPVARRLRWYFQDHESKP